MVIGITGSTGFIGQAVLRALPWPDSACLRCLVRDRSPRSGLPPAEWMQGDLMNEADCEEFVDGLDVVLHLAQSNSPATSDRHWPSDFTANIAPSLNLLEALRRRQGRGQCHLIFASSGGAVYGRLGAGRGAFREGDQCNPLSPYGIQKLMIEHYLQTACDQGWLRATVLRIGNAYGSLLAMERRQGFIGVAMARLISGKPVRIFGPVGTVRDYVHVDDVARAFTAVLAADHRQGKEANWRIFNIGSGVGHSVSDVIDLMSQIMDCNVATESCDFGAAPISSVPAVILDSSKAAGEIGWEPRVKLRKGIADMCGAGKIKSLTEAPTKVPYQ